MVRFVTTSYTHMYGNGYIARPEEPYLRKKSYELSNVGIIVEKWRRLASLTIDELPDAANRFNPLRDQRITAKDYRAFIHGRRRLSSLQLRTIAKALNTTVYIMMHYPPDKVPDKKHDETTKSVIVVSSPKREQSPTVKKQPSQRAYDPDDAARLLAKKFGKVKRFKQ